MRMIKRMQKYTPTKVRERSPSVIVQSTTNMSPSCSATLHSCSIKMVEYAYFYMTIPNITSVTCVLVPFLLVACLLQYLHLVLSTNL